MKRSIHTNSAVNPTLPFILVFQSNTSYSELNLTLEIKMSDKMSKWKCYLTSFFPLRGLLLVSLVLDPPDLADTWLPMVLGLSIGGRDTGSRPYGGDPDWLRLRRLLQIIEFYPCCRDMHVKTQQDEIALTMDCKSNIFEKCNQLNNGLIRETPDWWTIPILYLCTKEICLSVTILQTPVLC